MCAELEVSRQGRQKKDDNGVRSGDEGGEQRSMGRQQSWGTNRGAEAEQIIL